MRSWLRRWRDGLGAYLLLAAFLTLLMAGFMGHRTVEAMSVRFVINLIIALCIGGALDGAKALVLGRVRDRPKAVRIALLSLAVACSVVIGTEVARLIIGAVFPSHLPWFPRKGVLWVAIPVTVGMTAISIGRERLETRATEAREQALKAQLEALKARTNPHFLFNALNAVAALIGEDPARAEAAVLRLASLLRYALEASKKDRVPLAEELKQVEGYLAFERERFGEKLSAAVEVEPAAAEVMVPPLILQPLVENAVNHGVASRSAGGRVVVRATRAVGMLRLVVEDDGPGPGASPHQGTRTSQADLDDRLRLAYGGRARFTTSRGELGGFKVELELPE